MSFAMTIDTNNSYNVTYTAPSKGINSALTTQNSAANSLPQVASTYPSARGSDVTLSDEAKALQTSTAVYRMDTGSGTKQIDLDRYFIQSSPVNDLASGAANLLLPSSNNVLALQEHISSVFPDFLTKHGISEAPQTMLFDNQGTLVLPNDYAYKEELTAALEQHPDMLKTLKTAHALSSHVAGIQATAPMREALAQANSQAEVDIILENFSAYLGDNRAQAYPEISLQFSAKGELTITADGQSLV
jgi:hypothetical protein